MNVVRPTVPVRRLGAKTIHNAPMRVLVCPDKFAGTASADAVADAIATGWREAFPDDDVLVRPLADGGPGFLDVLRGAISGRVIEVPTSDPLGRDTRGWILVAGQTAYVESAQACGLHLLSEDERDPRTTSSRGLGLLINAAVREGAKEVVVGLGGSATNDGGAGMLAALGAQAVSAAGTPVADGGAALLECDGLHGMPDLGGAMLVAATDVDSPLIGRHGASAVFGPQKGADADAVKLLDMALSNFSRVLIRDLPQCPPALDSLPCSGAAGGLGAAILACGGRCESGIALVTSLLDLENELASSDIVITGEGKFDTQSISGKTVSGVAKAAMKHAVPCVVLAGQVGLDPETALTMGVTDSFSLAEHFGSLARAMTEPLDGLREMAAELARSRHTDVD
jgi:glycerate 2-kinase